jgi:hypothetical protein
MPSSRQQPRQLTEHRLTLPANDQIFVAINLDFSCSSVSIGVANVKDALPQG